MRKNSQGYKSLQIPSTTAYNFQALQSLVTLHHLGKCRAPVKIFTVWLAKVDKVYEPLHKY